jgi:peptidyl-prolyl cis-trans isomerase A (cyclophilin A)
MVQGGGFTPDMREKVTASPIQNESNNGLSNRRGTLAMARKDDPHSSTSQFFVNLIDNTFLDGGAVADGYTVFGRVTEGMPVIDRIAGKETHEVGAFTDVPVDTVTIFSAERED